MIMASPAQLLDPVLPGLCRSWPCALNNTAASFTFTRYCCKMNGVRLTVTKSAAQESVELAENAFQINLIPIADQIEIQKGRNLQLSTEAREMKRCRETIKYMFRSIEDGEISISPYDTAWVARVPALDGGGKPQFPSCLQWIIDHQDTDGSWGDVHIFHIRERIVNTLACVIALKTWKTAPRRVDKGLSFLQTYIPEMNEEDDVYSPIGFEIVFPALMEDAKDMSLALPYNHEYLHKIYDERALKLKRIPMEYVHNFPSTLLHSLEGLRDQVDWTKLLKLQSDDGSFLFSPASTACALAQTSDMNCARYLDKITQKHNGGVPNVYPVDLFEHLWMVDRLERLGIARYFQEEIKDNLEYVYRYWTNQGIGWARESPVQDVDDTSMAFRLLRLHGFDVTTEAFSHFKEGDQFICFKGQASQAVTGMYNLYRASQVLFPGESILEEAQMFSKKFLEDKKAKNQISDKWIISKGLVGEVEYSLNFPWYASLPRIETRMYIEQYGMDDVWIGKSLYRMPFVNNKTYIDLARADFNQCQSIHRKELHEIIRWCRECRFDELGLVQDSIVKAYFLAAAAVFEPDMAPVRLAWAHSSILMAAVRILFSHSSSYHKRQFLGAFARWDITAMQGDVADIAKRLLTTLFRTINLICLDGGVAQDRDIGGVLRDTWLRWLAREVETEQEDDGTNVCLEAEVIVMSASFLGGEMISRDSISRPEFTNTMKLTNAVCSLLRAAASSKEMTGCDRRMSVTEEEDKVKHLRYRADVAMRELVWAVQEGHRGVPSTAK
ncbi:hypothetical protein KI387_037667, partial [Taxus chinensis]